MNKSALKNFATNARRELLERVELQARKIGITKNSIQQANVESSDAIYIDGRQLSNIERRQRNKLIGRIHEIGFDRVMEETAYTWFNRFIALRFMEVNDYLPTRVRALSSTDPSSNEPDMMKEALTLDLDIDKEYVYDLKVNNKTDELFKYLIKLYCNDLNRYMPFMFETIEDYTEILFPEGLLGTDSFVREMTNTAVIPEDNWEKIEVIGWLYQYYIAEEKDRVFKEKKKYKAEEIPYATQLFTPEWIVRYMVQNSLGRYWVEAHPEDSDLTKNWELFIEHEEDFQEKIEPYINKELNVEDIKCFDPAMGSGHILVYMFDVLYEIYSKNGYMEREIPRLIIENNLYGLDIDDRAYQLACFSVVMKAMQYNRRFLRSIERYGLTLNLAAIQETNHFTDDDIAFIAGEESGQKFNEVKLFLDQFLHAKTIGSLLKINYTNIEFLKDRLNHLKVTPVDDLFDDKKRNHVLTILPKLIKQTKIMNRTYDVLITNPPYMGSGSMNKELSAYLKKQYPDSKSDLFAAFMEIGHYLKQNGFYAAINQHSWMFLSSYEKLRKKIIKSAFIDTMLHLGPRAFDEIGGEVVQSTTFILRKILSKDMLKGKYLRLVEYKPASKKREKMIEALQDTNVPYRYVFKQNAFGNIPGSPIVYWLTNNMIKVFSQGQLLSNFGIARRGLQTGDSARFIRNWFEVSVTNLFLDNKPYTTSLSNEYKWFLFNSGGSYRKWYGNIVDVVDWKEDGSNIKTTGKAIIPSEDKYFKPCISWNKVSSGNFAVRYQRQGIIQGDASPFFYTENQFNLKYIIALLNASVVGEIMKVLSPTLNYEVGNISRIPVIFHKDLHHVIERLVDHNISISKKEWDSFEISWDFKKHPLRYFQSITLKSAFEEWKKFTETQFNQLKENEEELNHIFIKVYGLQDEFIPDVADKDVTIQKADLERDMKSFISYAIGCAFGRYSLDEEGLIYAGGDFDSNRYKTFPADEDNILPIIPGPYFEDDIVNRFIHFVQVTYGEETLEENLDFIADAIGRRKNETSRETIRRYFLNDFYKDHVRTYKKRPIYWLFTSGKEKAFNCLIYMHRYDKTTLSRIRTDYLHDVQTRYETERQDLMSIIQGDSTAKEIRDAKRELKLIEKKLDEIKMYDEKLHHMADQQIEIDLDDGVKVNYSKFKGLVAKI